MQPRPNPNGHSEKGPWRSRDDHHINRQRLPAVWCFSAALQVRTRHAAREKALARKKDFLYNYRPVNNLSFVSKVMERTVALQLDEHVATYQLLAPSQSACHAQMISRLRLDDQMSSSRKQRWSR